MLVISAYATIFAYILAYGHDACFHKFRKNINHGDK